MKIHWNRVTWYSKLVALVLFILLPFLGFHLGLQHGRALSLIDFYRSHEVNYPRVTITAPQDKTCTLRCE